MTQWIEVGDTYKKQGHYGILEVSKNNRAFFHPSTVFEAGTHHLDECICPTIASTKAQATKYYNDYVRDLKLDGIKDNLAGTLFVMLGMKDACYYSDCLELSARELRKLLRAYYKRCHNGWFSQGGSKILYRLYPDLHSRDCMLAEDILDAENAFTHGVPYKDPLTGGKSLLLHMPDHLINIGAEVQNMSQLGKRKTYSFYIRNVIRKGGFKSMKEAKLGAINAYLLRDNGRRAFRKVQRKYVKNGNQLDESQITDEGKRLLEQFKEMFPESQGLISFGGFIGVS